MQNGAFTRELFGSVAAVMKLDRFSHSERQLPAPQQRPADIGVIEAESLPFNLVQTTLLVVGYVNYFPAHIGELGKENQTSDIVQDTSHKEPFQVCFTLAGCKNARSEGCADAVAPETFHGDQILRKPLEKSYDRNGQRQVAYLLDTDYGDGLSDRINFGKVAEQGAVCQFENTGRQSLIFGQHLGDVGDRAARVVDGLIKPGIEHRQGWY